MKFEAGSVDAFISFMKYSQRHFVES